MLNKKYNNLNNDNNFYSMNQDINIIKKKKDGIPDINYEGKIIIKSALSKKTKKNDRYYFGTILNKNNMNISFNAFEEDVIKKIDEIKKNNNSEIIPAKIIATGNIYKENFLLKLKDVELQEDLDIKEFIKEIDYSSSEEYQKYKDFIENNVDKGKEIIKNIINKDNYKRFINEFAAAINHDNQKSGLSAHINKMLDIAKTLVENENYKKIFKTSYEKDLLYMGIILHDIGKIDELYYGTYTSKSIVSHKMLGLEYIIKEKENIIETYDENFYYQLVAILEGHHGEYGERPKTTMSYIVHLIDLLESNLAFINQSSDEPIIKINDYYLRQIK